MDKSMTRAAQTLTAFRAAITNSTTSFASSAWCTQNTTPHDTKYGNYVMHRRREPWDA